MKEEQLNNEELQLFSRRDLIVRSVIGVPFVAIIWRLWNLQVKNGVKYRNLSKGNRIRIRLLAAPRGIIYDRNSQILAKNIPSYSLMLTREDASDVHKLLRKISLTCKIPLNSLENALKAQRKAPKFQPIQIAENLTMRQTALIGTYQEEFSGVSIDVLPKRYYSLQNTAAHILGYMNEITKSQLKKLPINQIQSAKKVGQEGIESVYNKQLIGTDGGKQIEVDNSGREIKEYPNPVKPIPGNDIVLAIDERVQRRVEKIMGNRKGSVVVMNPNNGEVIAMVSLPSFDSNEFSQGLSSKRWRELKNHPSHVLSNKCIQGVYSPGSTFKMVVAAAALEEGVVKPDTEIMCDGYFRLNKRRYNCWKRTGHGKLNVTQAIVNSCNVFFYKVSMELGIEKIKAYADKFGLGRLTHIDLYNEARALIPNGEWYFKQYGKEWQMGETPHIAIGQGFTLVTPLQLVNYVSIIANGGKRVRPHLVKKIIQNDSVDKDGIAKIIRKTKLIQPFLEQVDLKPETLQILKKGMMGNVDEEHGTGVSARSNIVSIAGKTGTTQVISNEMRDKILREKGVVDKKFHDHAWFVSFAPVEKPKIAAVVMIEHGRSGRNAARLTRQIMEYYFTKIDPIPLVRTNQNIITS